MQLIDYLLQNKIQQQDFAAAIEVTPTAICRYVSGLREPRPDVARRIVAATNGKVRMADIYK